MIYLHAQSEKEMSVVYFRSHLLVLTVPILDEFFLHLNLPQHFAPPPKYIILLDFLLLHHCQQLCTNKI